MTRSFSDERVFDAPAATLFALWTDPDFQRARSLHLGTLEASCRLEREDGALILILDEARDTGFGARRFETRHVTRWDEASLTGRWSLEKTAGPGEAEADGTIAIVVEGPDRCRMILRGRLTVPVRILGPMIERLAVKALKAERATEARFVAASLSHPWP